MSNREEHHDTLSSLGFSFKQDDLPIINKYHGHWKVMGDDTPAENLWVVTTDGKGHPVKGHPSPQEIIDWADDQGWLPAYVAPYGRYVEGELDAIHLHDWIVQGRREMDNQHRHD
ncbi:hypothetical protein [Alicyclobacillus dauci]|uniref:Uncharacterized protein n=1 Tax=Alicyclobacillus dauci TaxID=1475485 RepID=A0ABY6Z359_9BACL|nr:hypothetical protein [Alicyclobacillus dauci]WAH37276.1 hypothetical protein NZD86_01625 [Alicyclobacillus dauci]